MHELGVLRHIVRTVSRVVEENRIKTVRFITLEVGTESTYVPAYLTRLFPLAVDQMPNLQNAQLRIQMKPGRELLIKEIGY